MFNKMSEEKREKLNTDTINELDEMLKHLKELGNETNLTKNDIFTDTRKILTDLVFECIVMRSEMERMRIKLVKLDDRIMDIWNNLGQMLSEEDERNGD